MPTMELDDILKANSAAKGSQDDAVILREFSASTSSANQAVFFIKPELSSVPDNDLKVILELVEEQFRRFDVEVDAIRVLGSRYLAAHNIIGDHYGVINAISLNGVDAVNPVVRSRLDTLFSDDITASASVLGGHQVLERFQFLNAASLAVLWDNLNQNSQKLAPGTYALPIQIFSERCIFLNGFHPHQLDHFNAPGQSIIAMVVHSNTGWKALRDAMIGGTDPACAAPGSMRRIFVEKQSELGIPVVNKGSNGVHFSAGPIEGMVEIIRFFSDYEKRTMVEFSDTCFGRMLLNEGLSYEEIAWLSGNPQLKIAGGSVSAFDLTEKTDPTEAIELLKQAIYPSPTQLNSPG